MPRNQPPPRPPAVRKIKVIFAGKAHEMTPDAAMMMKTGLRAFNGDCTSRKAYLKQAVDRGYDVRGDRVQEVPERLPAICFGVYGDLFWPLRCLGLGVPFRADRAQLNKYCLMLCDFMVICAMTGKSDLTFTAIEFEQLRRSTFDAAIWDCFFAEREPSLEADETLKRLPASETEKRLAARAALHRVGYKKPPVRTRFQKNVSGNPSGKAKPLPLSPDGEHLVPVTTQGQREMKPFSQALFLKLEQEALQDDQEAFDTYLKITAALDRRDRRPQLKAKPSFEAPLTYAVDARSLYPSLALLGLAEFSRAPDERGDHDKPKLRSDFVRAAILKSKGPIIATHLRKLETTLVEPTLLAEFFDPEVLAAADGDERVPRRVAPRSRLKWG